MKYVIDMDEEEHNRIRHFCSLTDINIPLGWFEIAQSKPLQEELEKIKNKMNEGLYDIPCDFNYGINYCVDIIENYIAELKGE